MRKTFSFLILFTLLMTVFLAACGPGDSPATLPIKIGVLDSYSGGTAVFGDDALNGFKLAVEEINAAGGVLGRQIEFTTRDTKFQMEVGLPAAKELVLNENVDILVGTINSTVAQAVSKYAKEEQIPFFVWSAKSEKITGEEGHRYVFSTGENSAMAGKAGAAALAEKPFLRYWIAGDDYEYGHAIADAVWRNLKTLKPDVELIGESWWATDELDLISYFTPILAAQPDAVIFACGGGSMAKVLKAVKSTGLADQATIWIHTATDHAVLEPLGLDAPEGIMGTMDYHFYYPDTPANEAFVQAFMDEYDYPPGFPAFHAYVTAHLIAAAYEKAGTTDREKFIDAMEGLSVDSPVGLLTMRACDHQIELPIYVGVTGRVPEYDFLVATEIETIPSAEVMPSCDEVLSARQGQ